MWADLRLLIGSHMMGRLALGVELGEFWMAPHLFGPNILWVELLI